MDPQPFDAVRYETLLRKLLALQPRPTPPALPRNPLRSEAGRLPECWSLRGRWNCRALFATINPPATMTDMLGLAYIIEDRGGEMWVESEGEEEGATFWFRIPLKRLAAKP